MPAVDDSAQLDLPFARPRRSSVEMAEAVAGVVRFLRGRGWQSRKVVCDRLGLNLRELRAIVSAAEPEILSGQSGYRLTAEATADEIGKAADQWQSQAEALHRKAIALRRRGHGLVR